MKAIKRIIPSGIDLRVLGEEPVWNQPATQGESIAAFNFYNAMCDEKEARVFVNVYLKENKFDQATIDAISKIPDNKIFGPGAWLCRMSSMGYIFSEREKEFLSTKIYQWTELGKFLMQEKRVVASGKNMQLIVEDAINKKIAEIDHQIDEFITGGFKSKFDTYTWLKDNSIKPMYANKIVSIYTHELKELKEVLQGKDEQLVEGYSNFTKANLKKLCSFFEKIITDAKTWSDAQKKNKTPRKRKAKSADQLTKNVRYQKSEESLRLVSLNPSKLIGATEAWIFNTKTRILSRYISADVSGFIIKGTSLKNFSESSSQNKKIRKPEELATNVASGGIRSVTKYFEAIKTKATECNGRLNETSIILRIV